MISVTITGVEKVRTALKKLENINLLVAEWMKSGSPDKIMQKSFLLNFSREGRPEKWQALSEETEMDRDYEGYDEGPILQRSGSLMNKITGMEGEVMVGFNKNVMTWGIDQLDSKTRKKFGPNQIGKGRSGQNLPARSMIGFQKSDGTVLMRDLRSWILKTL